MKTPKRLYDSACPSVRLSVGQSVGNAFAFWPTRSDLCRVYSLVSFIVVTKPFYISVRWSDGRYVMLLLFGLLGATYAVYTALLTVGWKSLLLTSYSSRRFILPHCCLETMHTKKQGCIHGVSCS